ncbi:MAG: aldose 1-epimerase family protein [Clostridia bacterium]|nr:aldose 1-epimerase family protein [Clostridia bacterium]
MDIYGIKSRRELSEKFGDIRQIASIERMQIIDSSGGMNHIIQVRNATGLRFEINISRGFDIGLCEIQGIPVSWVSSTGRVSPFFYDKEAKGWHIGFEGGLLTTCGLQQAGKPSIDESEYYGQHGKISYIPATLLQAEILWRHDECQLVCKGQIIETKACGEKLVLERTITTYLDKNRIDISDRVENHQFVRQPHMILYHLNFGYPLIDSNTHVHELQSEKEVVNGSDEALMSMQMPRLSLDGKPSVVLHKKIKSDSKKVEIKMSNEVRFNNNMKKLNVSISYNKEQCPYLSQWRNNRNGINVMAFEPGNVSTKGRKFHREQGDLPMLDFSETKNYDLTIEFAIKE